MAFSLEVLLVATLIAALGGCSGATELPAVPDDDTRTSKFLALGDSYTIGESVAPSDRWPVQLARALRASGAAIDNPYIIAKTGWTCSELSVAMDDARVGDRKYALVSLLVGVNDQYRGGAPEPYRQAFTDLLKRAIMLAGGEPKRVLVLSIPDWGATPFGRADPRGAERIGKEIDAFNQINREESERAGVEYVDVTPVSRDAKTNAALVAEDGLHPSAAMYAKWASLATPIARQVLTQRRQE